MTCLPTRGTSSDGGSAGICGGRVQWSLSHVPWRAGRGRWRDGGRRTTGAQSVRRALGGYATRCGHVMRHLMMSASRNRVLTMNVHPLRAESGRLPISMPPLPPALIKEDDLPGTAATASTSRIATRRRSPDDFKCDDGTRRTCSRRPSPRSSHVLPLALGSGRAHPCRARRAGAPVRPRGREPARRLEQLHRREQQHAHQAHRRPGQGL